MVGPSLVPLLTLGVPGSPTAAVLLGGLLIHGMFPGPNLFTIYAETTWTFINSLLVAQFMMLICVNGQLLLSMLAEQLVLKAKAKLIQVNTDGVMIKVARKNRHLVDQVTQEWMRLTSLKLDYDHLKFQRTLLYGNITEKRKSLPFHDYRKFKKQI